MAVNFSVYRINLYGKFKISNLFNENSVFVTDAEWADQNVVQTLASYQDLNNVEFFVSDPSSEIQVCQNLQLCIYF